MKRLGILGGMGPLASSVFYSKLVEMTEANCDQDHIDTLIISHASMPDRSSVILGKKNDSAIVAELSDLINVFKSYNVDNIAIVCNTFHYFYDVFSEMTDINVINMPDVTIQCIRNKYGSGCTALLLATRGTIDARVYQRYADLYGINLVYPTEAEKDMLMDCIYEIKSDGNTNKPQMIQMVNEYFNKGVDVAVAACTEISLVDFGDFSDRVVDAMDCLLRESIALSKE